MYLADFDATNRGSEFLVILLAPEMALFGFLLDATQKQLMVKNKYPNI